jgi:hypothetical protein
VEWAGPPGGVVLVRDNDLYYSPPPGTGPVLQLTRTGVPGVVFNGVTDWLYRGQSCSRIHRSCLGVKASFKVGLNSTASLTGSTEVSPVAEFIDPVRELKPALKWG